MIWEEYCYVGEQKAKYPYDIAKRKETTEPHFDFYVIQIYFPGAETRDLCLTQERDMVSLKKESDKQSLDLDYVIQNIQHDDVRICWKTTGDVYRAVLDKGVLRIYLRIPKNDNPTEIFIESR